MHNDNDQLVLMKLSHDKDAALCRYIVVYHCVPPRPPASPC